LKKILSEIEKYRNKDETIEKRNLDCDKIQQNEKFHLHISTGPKEYFYEHVSQDTQKDQFKQLCKYALSKSHIFVVIDIYLQKKTTVNTKAVLMIFYCRMKAKWI